MNTTKLENIKLSTEMMDASQISNYISLSVVAESKSSEGTEIGSVTINGNKTSFFASTSEVIDTNYTAFEVFPTDKVIPVGSKDTNDKTDPESVASIFDFNNTTATGLTYKEVVSQSMSIKFEVDECTPLSSSKLIVDWGDGVVQELKTLVVNSETENGCYKRDDYSTKGENYKNRVDYYLVHTYTKSGKYIIKIYGDAEYLNTDYNNKNTIISRVWDWDLPMNVVRPTSLAAYSPKLLSVNVPSSFSFDKVRRMASVFYHCINLQYFKISSIANRTMHDIDLLCGFVEACKNLKFADTTFFIPSSVTSFDSIVGGFQTDEVLDLLKFMPPNGFGTHCECGQIIPKEYKDGQAYTRYTKINSENIDELSKYFWNSKGTTFSNRVMGTDNGGSVSSAFKWVDVGFRLKVPYTFGGLTTSTGSGESSTEGCYVITAKDPTKANQGDINFGKHIIKCDTKLKFNSNFTEDQTSIGLGYGNNTTIVKNGIEDSSYTTDSINQQMSVMKTSFTPVVGEFTEYDIEVKKNEYVVVFTGKIDGENATVDWGNGKSNIVKEENTMYSSSAYTADGTYKIKITGGKLSYINKMQMLRYYINKGNPNKSPNTSWLLTRYEEDNNKNRVPLEYIGTGGYIDQKFELSPTSRTATTIAAGTGEYFVKNTYGKDVSTVTIKPAATVTFNTDIDMSKEPLNLQSISDINSYIAEQKSKSADAQIKVIKCIGRVDENFNPIDTDGVYRIAPNIATMFNINTEPLEYMGYTIKDRFMLTTGRIDITIRYGTGELKFGYKPITGKTNKIVIYGGVNITIKNADEMAADYQTTIFNVIKTTAPTVKKTITYKFNYNTNKFEMTMT